MLNNHQVCFAEKKFLFLSKLIENSNFFIEKSKYDSFFDENIPEPAKCELLFKLNPLFFVLLKSLISAHQQPNNNGSREKIIFGPCFLQLCKTLIIVLHILGSNLPSGNISWQIDTIATIFMQTIYPKGLTILFHLCAVHKNLINWKDINYREIFKFLFDCVFPKNPESFYINVSLLAKLLEAKGLIKNYKPIGSSEKCLFILQSYTLEMTKCLILLFDHNANTDKWFIKTENNAPCIYIGQFLSKMNNLKYYWKNNSYTLVFTRPKLHKKHLITINDKTVVKVNNNNNDTNSAKKNNSSFNKTKYNYKSSAHNKVENGRFYNKRKFESVSPKEKLHTSVYNVAEKTFSEANPYSILKKYKMESDINHKENRLKNDSSLKRDVIGERNNHIHFYQNRGDKNSSIKQQNSVYLQNGKCGARDWTNNNIKEPVLDISLIAPKIGIDYFGGKSIYLESATQDVDYRMPRYPQQQSTPKATKHFFEYRRGKFDDLESANQFKVFMDDYLQRIKRAEF